MAAGKNRDARIAIWLFISMFLFASGIRCQYGAEPRKYPLDSETQDALQRFTDVYGLIKREYITPMPFPDLIENTLKGLQDLLGKERLSYVRSDHRFIISCSGENITVNEVSNENQLMKVCECLLVSGISIKVFLPEGQSSHICQESEAEGG